MPLYENVFIARQDISGAQVDALADAFTQIVADNGGEVKKREYWGLRNLMYRMRKNRKGHYVLLNLSAPPAAVAELERTMRINEDVIRYLTIRVDELEDGPSVVMQSRGSRDDRQRRGDRERSGDGREMERPVAEHPVPEQTVPEQAVPEQAVPEQAVPEQTVPEQAVPEQAVPEQAVPEQAVPEQAVPEQAVPEQAVPEQAVPEQPVPETVEA
jgi:small subunit ribosomal protein S6